MAAPQNNKKRRMSAKPICRYGEECYRKNPIHLEEYSHPHLELILKDGLDEYGEFIIPVEFYLARDTITDQLKVLQGLNKSSRPTKIPKVKDEPAISQLTLDNKSAVITPVKPIKNCLPIETSIKKEKSSDKSGPTPSLSSVNPSINVPTTPLSSSTKTFNSIPVTPNTNTLQNLKDFFKERAAKPPPPGSPVRANDEATTSTYKPASASASRSNDAFMDKLKSKLGVLLPKGKMADKLKNAAPYNFFLTTIQDSKDTHADPLCVTLQEILDNSLGILESSVQFNFVVDIGWLLAHYMYAGHVDKPMLLFYGQESPELVNLQSKRPNITPIHIKVPGFGIHHTKMMLLFYKDQSMRVVISTANLYEDDWVNRVQGLWISERLPELEGTQVNLDVGESPTNFRADLQRYLIAYNQPKLQPIIARIRKLDFSSVNVFLVAASPGSHREQPNRGHPYGHPRLGYLLSKHSAPIDDSCPIVAQSSSIGSFGAHAGLWISEISMNFKKDSVPQGLRKAPQFKMIYPSFTNVKNSYDGMIAGGCLPYRRGVHEKQTWLNAHLQQWKSNDRNMTKSMPHIKSYCRYSERGMYWFCLTSANMSKSAWGSFNSTNKLEAILRVNNYEVGVLWLPRVVLHKPTFPMNRAQQTDNSPIFKMPFDCFPLTPYNTGDTPFVFDYLDEYLKKLHR